MNSNHPSVKGYATHVEICDYDNQASTSKGGIYIELQDSYQKKPLKVEIECSGTDNTSTIAVMFNTTGTSIPRDRDLEKYNVSVSSGTDLGGGHKKLTFTAVASPSGAYLNSDLPLTSIKIINNTSSPNKPISIYSVTVYYSTI